jgi:hypothetical protein
MPPIAVPPVVVLAALGTVIMARWAAREFRRVNELLDDLRRATQPEEPVDRSRLPTLQRDPATGEYRPQ